MNIETKRIRCVVLFICTIINKYVFTTKINFVLLGSSLKFKTKEKKLQPTLSGAVLGYSTILNYLNELK